MLKPIAMVIAVLLAGFLVYAWLQPDSFSVSRSIAIKAPPEKIYALMADFHRFPEWSPYEGRDPAMRRTLGGSAAGPGATYAWAGNSQVGAGRMEITWASPPTAITIRLDMQKPIEGHNIVEFTLRPEGETTIVTWSMHGPSPFIARVMGTIFDMDRMIGTDFGTGLARLKTLIEK